MWSRIMMVLVLCFGSIASAAPHAPTQMQLQDAPKKPRHKKMADLRAERVMKSLVQIPSAAQPVERGQLNFMAGIDMSPNVYLGAALFSVLTILVAHSESVTASKVLCGPTHVGPAILDSGFGVAVSGTY